MLVRGRRALPQDAGELLRAPGIHRFLSRRAVGTSAGLAVSVAEKPVVRRLTTGGPIIGTFLNEPYEQETIQLKSGDILVVYTDGVTEALNPAGLEFGEERLRSIVAESLQLPARELAKEIITKVQRWQAQAAQHDDITLIVVRVK
jgi:sigma-B regulation protein RsbU (phosphoserine phosphatase)